MNGPPVQAKRVKLAPLEGPARTMSVAQRLSASLVRPCVAFPLIGLSLVLLGWSLLFRLPKAPVIIQARPLQLSAGTNELVTVKTVTELERVARNSAQHLMRDSTEIAPLLAALEQSARALGFQVEVSMKPAISNAAGFKELGIHPAVVRLENDYTQDRPAFARSLDWLRQISALTGKVDVYAVSLRSNGDGVARAEVELHFWRMTDLNESAPK